MHVISATDFVQAIFGNELDQDECALVAVKSGSGFPASEASAANLARIEAKPGPWYICGSTVVRQEPLRRRNSDLVSTWAIALDDIGTKSTAPTVQPSARVVTSVVDGVANEQWWYFIEPTEDHAYVSACYSALAAAGHTDPGAKGGARLFRLPGSVNTKPGREAYVSTVVEWEPERVWNLRELMAQFALKPKPRELAPLPDVDVPAAIVDPVLEWLSDQGRLGVLGEFGYEVTCPWAHNHTTGDGGAAYSPLGHGMIPLYRVFKCLHGHCEAKRGEAFLAWVAEQGGPAVSTNGVREIDAYNLADLAEDLTPAERRKLLRASLPIVHKGNLPDLERTVQGVAKAAQLCTDANVTYVAEVIGARVRTNMLTHSVEIDFEDDHLNAILPPRLRHDAAMAAVVDACTVAGITASQRVASVLERLAMDGAYSPICEWIDSVPWDGRSRFDELVGTIVCAVGEHEDNLRLYLRRWMIQAIQAWHNWQGEPQAVEHVLVLNGAQGVGKTNWLRRLVPREFFSEGVYLSLGKGTSGDRDAVRRATCAPLVELGELETTFSKSEVGHQKNFLSQAIDTYRAAYGATEVSYPRTTVFAATVNINDFLIDPTGSRRYWPIRLLNCHAWHDIDMQQMWSEAKTWWLAGEQFHLNAGEEDARLASVAKFQFETPVAEMVRDYFSKYKPPCIPMTATMFMVEKLKLTPNNMNKRDVTVALEAQTAARSQKIDGIDRAWSVPNVPKTHEDMARSHLTLVPKEPSE